MNKNRVTKKVVLAAVRALVEGKNEIVTVDDIEVSTDDILAYVDTTVAQLDAKNAKAKAKAAEKRAAGDELANAIADVLTDEFKTIPAIVEELAIEDLTPGKVSARLTQLVKAGRAHKSKVKDGDRTINGYAAGPDEDAE